MSSDSRSSAAGSSAPRRVGYVLVAVLGVLLVTATRAVLTKRAPTVSRTPTSADVAAATSAATSAAAAPSMRPASADVAATVREVAPATVRPRVVAQVASPSHAEFLADAIADAAADDETPALAARPLVTAPEVGPVASVPDIRTTGISAGRAPAPAWDWHALAALPGVHLNATEITDASSGTAGMSGAHAVRTHSNLELRVNFDSLIGWSGLSVYAQHKSKTGRNGSGEASFMQNYSNIDAGDFRAFGEVFVQQRLLDDRVRVKVGRLDLNSEFAGTAHGVSFLNSSMGYTPAITAAPTFPLPVGAVNVMVSPVSGLHLSAGLFDGSTGAPSVDGRASRFQIAQAAQEWAGGVSALDGRIGVGAWRHTGLFSRITDNPESESSAAGTHGWYVTLDQTLWRGAARANDDLNRATVAGFVQVGEADKQVAAVNSHRGAGVTLTGLWSHRSSDVMGVGVTNAAWSTGHETIGEMFYQLPVFSHLSLVADWQSVGRRSALDERAKGHVFTLRSIVSF